MPTKNILDNDSNAIVYDTADTGVKSAIRTKLRSILQGNAVDTAGGSKTAPKTVKAGFLFCAFKDVLVEDINADYQLEVVNTKPQLSIYQRLGLAEKTFPGNRSGKAPFSLSLDSSDPANIYLVVNDAAKTETNSILLNDSVLKSTW